MSTSLLSKSQNKIRPSQILGAMGWEGFDEDSNEKESSLPSILGGLVGEVIKESANLFKQEVAGVEDESEENQENKNKLAIGGETELKFDKKQAELEEKLKQKEKADKKTAFYQALRDEQLRAQMAKDKMWLEEEINDITTNISTEEKNALLHYQASYKDRSTYQKAELRKKLIEQKRKAETQQKEASVPSPAKQPSALEGAFEGTSGSVGSGTANFGKGAVQ